MPVLPIPHDPQDFTDKPCWTCGGSGTLNVIRAKNIIENVIEEPHLWSPDEAKRIALLATEVIFDVRDAEPPF